MVLPKYYLVQFSYIPSLFCKIPTFDVPFTSATIPVINLSGFNLNLKGLKYDLHHCFIDKSRLVRRNIATELEYLAHTVQKGILSEDKILMVL